MSFLKNIFFMILPCVAFCNQLFSGEPVIKLASIFSDGAVLQREKIIPIWGTARPNEKLTAELAGQKVYTMSSREGNFFFTFPKMSAGGPYELVISDKRGNKVTIKNILIGEVWLASGQSNMQYQLGADMAVKKSPPGVQSLARKQEAEFKNLIADRKFFRFITITPQERASRESSFQAKWQDVTPQTAPKMSAVAAWFGYEISKTLNVPVGIIVAAKGGTVIEAWTSRGAGLSNPHLKKAVEQADAFYRSSDAYLGNPTKVWKFICGDVPNNTGAVKGWANPDYDDSQWLDMEVPGSWIRQNICGNGSIWARTVVNLPKSAAGKELILKLGTIDKQDITYFNGQEVGRSGAGFEYQYADKCRQYKIPGKLVKAGRNVLAIRAYSFLYDGSIGGFPEQYIITDLAGKTVATLSGVWKAKAEYDAGALYPSPLATTLFNGMIRPLLPYAIRGVLWYQGESNANSVANSTTYADKLATMIGDWRRHWEDETLVFLQVQIANYGRLKPYVKNAHRAILRDGQRILNNRIPNLFMVSAIDVGEADDVHSQNKQPLGERLAKAALHHVYEQKNVVPCGPVLQKTEQAGHGIRLYFNYADGMELRDLPGKSFFLAGKDGKYFPADKVEILGNSLLLFSKQVDVPYTVRYAWADNPYSILYNNSGLPASPFDSSKE